MCELCGIERLILTVVQRNFAGYFSLTQNFKKNIKIKTGNTKHVCMYVYVTQFVATLLIENRPFCQRNLPKTKMLLMWLHPSGLKQIGEDVWWTFAVRKDGFFRMLKTVENLVRQKAWNKFDSEWTNNISRLHSLEVLIRHTVWM